MPSSHSQERINLFLLLQFPRTDQASRQLHQQQQHSSPAAPPHPTIEGDEPQPPTTTTPTATSNASRPVHASRHPAATAVILHQIPANSQVVATCAPQQGVTYTPTPVPFQTRSSTRLRTCTLPAPVTPEVAPIGPGLGPLVTLEAVRPQREPQQADGEPQEERRRSSRRRRQREGVAGYLSTLQTHEAVSLGRRCHRRDMAARLERLEVRVEGRDIERREQRRQERQDR